MTQTKEINFAEWLQYLNTIVVRWVNQSAAVVADGAEKMRVCPFCSTLYSLFINVLPKRLYMLLLPHIATLEGRDNNAFTRERACCDEIADFCRARSKGSRHEFYLKRRVWGNHTATPTLDESVILMPKSWALEHPASLDLLRG